jgi:hypothetical protein
MLFLKVTLRRVSSFREAGMEKENDQQAYVTRRGLLARARDRGIPLAPSRLNKDAAAGCGHKVAAIYGRNKELYTLAEADRYINSTIRPVTHEVAEKLKSENETRRRARLERQELQPPAAT